MIRPTTPHQLLFSLFFAALVFSASADTGAGDSTSLTMRLARATELATTNHRDDARDLLEKITAEYPDSPEAYNNLAVLAAYSEEWEEAIGLLEKALATDASMHTSYQNLSRIYRYQAALAYRAALPGDKESPLSLPDLQMLQAAVKSTPTITTKTIEQAENQPESSVVEPVAHVDDIVFAVHRWAGAWSAQDVDAYLASYAADYQPDPQMDHDTWRKVRRSRLLTPAFIDIELRNEQVDILASNSALVTFIQSYHSTSFKDSVKKILLMELTKNGWLITREHVIR